MLLKNFELKLVKGKLKRIFPRLLCTLGCMIHIACSLDYFSYPTILETLRQLDTETSYTLTVCIDSYHFFKAQAGIHSDFNLDSWDYHIEQSKLLNMSMEDMFENKPDENSIIGRCRVWGEGHRKVNDLSIVSDWLMLRETNGTQCHKYFRVKKSFAQSKICFSFTPTVKLDWNRQ